MLQGSLDRVCQLATMGKQKKRMLPSICHMHISRTRTVLILLIFLVVVLVLVIIVIIIFIVLLVIGAHCLTI